MGGELGAVLPLVQFGVVVESVFVARKHPRITAVGAIERAGLLVFVIASTDFRRWW